MKQAEFVPPPLGGLTDEAELVVDLPDMTDVENPAIRRAIERVRTSQSPNSPSAHQKHSSHDRTGHTQGLW